jgi:hypothetical protein
MFESSLIITKRGHILYDLSAWPEVVQKAFYFVRLQQERALIRAGYVKDCFLCLLSV